MGEVENSGGGAVNGPYGLAQFTSAKKPRLPEETRLVGLEAKREGSLGRIGFCVTRLPAKTDLARLATALAGGIAQEGEAGHGGKARGLGNGGGGEDAAQLVEAEVVAIDAS